MKKKLWKPLSNYLKTGSKKNKFLLIFLAVSFRAAALDAEFIVKPGPDSAEISAKVEKIDVSQLARTLTDGLRCGISFEFQIYEERTAIADSFVLEYAFHREGKWDPFSQSYLISESDGYLRLVQGLGEFMDYFLTLKNYNIIFEKKPDSQYYILCRVKVEIIKLVPPFQILAPGMNSNFPATTWIKKNLY